MPDKFDKITRSNIMAKVKGKNTLPELTVRKLLFSMGYRYRLHCNDLPGKPDIVLPKYSYVIFVHGCFWHGCPSCRRAQVRPVNNAEYWSRKLDKNIERDKKNKKELKKLGWNVFVIWECEIKKANADKLFRRIRKAIK